VTDIGPWAFTPADGPPCCEDCGTTTDRHDADCPSAPPPRVEHKPRASENTSYTDDGSITDPPF